MLVNFHQNCLLFLHGNVWMTVSYISEVIFSQEKFRLFWETTWGLNPENHHRSTAKAENRNWLHDISIILKIMKNVRWKPLMFFFLKQSERDEEKWRQTSESLGGKWYKKYPKILHPKLTKKIICWADTPCYPDQANYWDKKWKMERSETISL